MVSSFRYLKVNSAGKGITTEVYLRLTNFTLAHEKLHSVHKSFYSIIHRIKSNQRTNTSEFQNTKFVKFLDFKLILDPNEPHDYTFYTLSNQNRPYEEETSDILIDNLKKDDTFIDVGANNGYFSLLASTLVGKKGRVFAFEPNPRAINKLKKSIKLNKFKNIKAFNIALGSRNTIKKLYLSTIEDGLNSFVNKQDTKGFIKSQIKKLDSLNIKNKIDFIKIDVEGYELDVLKGSKRVLMYNNPIIIFEYNPGITGVYEHFNEIIKFLDLLGFEVHDITSQGLSARIESVKDLSYKQTNLLAYKKGLVILKQD